jgi:hypothetical protein
MTAHNCRSEMKLPALFYILIITIFLAPAVALAQPAAETPAPAVEKISVFPSRLQMRAGDEMRFLVTAHLSDGFEEDVTDKAELRVSNGDFAAVSGGGIINAKAPGSGTVSAVYAGHQVEIPVEIQPRGVADAPTFVRDILPVLSKAGCSAGSCHAKPDGQNGFRLSVGTPRFPGVAG